MRLKRRTIKKITDMAKLAETIVNYRIAHNVSMVELSEMTGISLKTLFYLENRKRTAIYEKTRILLDKFGFAL